MSDERFKFAPKINQVEFARDATRLINKLLDAGGYERKAFLKLKWEVAEEMLAKYPGMDSSAKTPLEQMKREAKNEFKLLMDAEEVKSEEAV